MLTATYEFSGATDAEKESTAKEQYFACFATDDPGKCAAQIGAGAACAYVGGPYAAAFCSLAAGKVWDAIFPKSCKDMGGTKWVIRECVEGTWVSPGAATKCTKSVRIDPVPYADYWASGRPPCGIAGGKTPCATQTYCQLPGTPRPPHFTPTYMTPTEQRRALLESRGRTFTPTHQQAVSVYPRGAVAAQEPATGTWKVAAPRGDLAGEATYAIIDTRSTKPSGVPIVSYTDLLRRTGQLPWYKDWRVWAVTGAAAVAGTAGLVVWKRRKRRKRR